MEKNQKRFYYTEMWIEKYKSFFINSSYPTLECIERVWQDLQDRVQINLKKNKKQENKNNTAISVEDLDPWGSMDNNQADNFVDTLVDKSASEKDHHHFIKLDHLAECLEDLGNERTASSCIYVLQRTGYIRRIPSSEREGHLTLFQPYHYSALQSGLIEQLLPTFRSRRTDIEANHKNHPDFQDILQSRIQSHLKLKGLRWQVFRK